MKNILITGGAGQVGTELGRLDWGADIHRHQPARGELDIASPSSVEQFFARTPIDLVINTAAYTAVDQAESKIGDAFAINALGPALLAGASAQAQAAFIQISTDYVFSGDKSSAYLEDDPTAPLGVYGASKLAGELAVQAGNPRSVILRTAWVLSAHRSNFLKTMRRLAAQRTEIGVVADQIGCPTSAADIAQTVRTIAAAQLADRQAPCGTYHFVNAGEASWHGLASEIIERSATKTTGIVVRPITTADYPTPARRPQNSRLSTAKLTRDFDVTPRPWLEAVSDIIAELDMAENHDGAAT